MPYRDAMKNSELTVRRARPDDATAIAEVHVASWRTTYPGIVDQAYIRGDRGTAYPEIWYGWRNLLDLTA
jgi:hypothetical protein